MAETDEIVDTAKAGFGVGSGAGAAGAGAAAGAGGAASGDHYGPGSIVLLAVDHVRVMRGETDEVVERMRSSEVERWVVGVFEDCGAAPDWFLDRWMEGDGADGRMVTVACFEDAGAAKTFADGVRAKMAADEAEGRTPCVRIVEDGAWRAEEARRFSEEWARAHERGMARSVGVIDAAVRDGTAARAMVCEVEVCGGEGADADAEARRAADGMRAVLDQVFDGVADPVLFSGMLDRGRGMLSVALCVKAEAAERVAPVELLNCLVAAGYGFTMVTGADARRESDAVVVQIAEVLAKAGRGERRSE